MDSNPVGELLAAALAYQQTGWSIIPAALEGKCALVPWKHWQQVAPSTKQLAGWARRWPRCNWAVITGRVSGVVVIDVDPRHDGDLAIAVLEAEHGDLPMLATVETPSGGEHRYLRWPGFKIPNSTGRLGPGLDVRGDGGLALLPPSRCPDGAYRWALGGPSAAPTMPAAWAELLRPAPSSSAAAAPRTAPGAAHRPGEGSDYPGRQQHAARLAGILRALQRTPIGQRNNTLYWCGRRLAELVDQGAPADWRHTLAAAARQCGLDPAEIEDTLDSALGAER